MRKKLKFKCVNLDYRNGGCLNCILKDDKGNYRHLSSVTVAESIKHNIIEVSNLKIADNGLLIRTDLQKNKEENIQCNKCKHLVTYDEWSSDRMDYCKKYKKYLNTRDDKVIPYNKCAKLKEAEEKKKKDALESLDIDKFLRSLNTKH